MLGGCMVDRRIRGRIPTSGIVEIYTQSPFEDMIIDLEDATPGFHEKDFQLGLSIDEGL